MRCLARWGRGISWWQRRNLLVFQGCVMKRANNLSLDRRMYRYEVELKELVSGVNRRLPLLGFQLIPLPRRKGDVVGPPREIWRLEDGNFQLEAETLEEFKVRLRAQYPDEQYERRLLAWRDRDAEARRDGAIMDLARIVA